MNKLIIIAIIYTLIPSLGIAEPTPIEPPKFNIAAASEKVLAEYKNEYPVYKDPPFIISASYGSFERLVVLADLRSTLQYYPKLKKKMGWLVTVLSYNDLSQSDTYFIDQDTEITHVSSTD